MFHAASPYSPFFTSGLLSSSSSSELQGYSIPPDSAEDLGPRRGSLPTSGAAHEHGQDLFYYQSRRNLDLCRSFLSLDLAESQSLRTQASTSSHPNSSARTSGRVSQSPMLSPSTRRPISRMSSRCDSLTSRLIPSPKPAPSSTLPAVPFVFGSAPIEPQHTPPQVPPRMPLVDISHTQTPANVFTLERAPHRHSTLSKSVTITSSKASTTYKKSRRADALACLEGRSSPPVALPPRGENFMSMSDDEEEDQDDDHFSLDSSDDDDDENWASATPFEFEEEDRVLPPSPTRPSRFVPMISSPPIAARKPSLRRRSTLESWFPLASFIDVDTKKKSQSRPQSSGNFGTKERLHEPYLDKWSSFIEIAGLS